MTVRVGINGLGRIHATPPRRAGDGSRYRGGRGQRPDLTPDPGPPAAYDSTQGRMPVPVDVEGGDLLVGEHHIRVLAEREPEQLPWGALGVEVVIESTASSRRGRCGRPPPRHRAPGHHFGPLQGRRRHLRHRSERRRVRAQEDIVVSNASCTTNCFVPMVKVLDDRFEIVSGLMTTVHAYTNDQTLRPDPHRPAPGVGRCRQHRPQLDRRRPGHQPRAVGHEGPARRHVPGARAGRLHHPLHRRGTGEPDGGRGQRRPRGGRAKPPLDRVLDYTEDPLVSSDIVGTSASCTLNAGLTIVQPIDDALSLVKVEGWYDDEWG